MTLPSMNTTESPSVQRMRQEKSAQRYAGAQITRVQLQGCNWFSCAGVAISCALACASGVGTAGCIACLGSAYNECKDCF